MRSTLCVLLALLNALMVFTGTVGVDVLCIGDDGHVAMEDRAAQAACCGDESNKDSTAGWSSAAEHACVDIPVSDGERKASENGRSLIQRPMMVVAFSLDAIHSTGANLFTHVHFDNAPPSCGALPALRTIVLLT
jgi:hypothetical protein